LRKTETSAIQLRLIGCHLMLLENIVPPKTILSISYDDTLLQTRQLLLETRGYSVTSSFGFTHSLEQCKRSHWDLIIIGHSIPDQDKRALMTQFRRNCQAPVLALHRLHEARLEDADYTITLEHPEQLLVMVDKILGAGASARGQAGGPA
jgi:CheY-like chemotaxis protein